VRTHVFLAQKLTATRRGMLAVVGLGAVVWAFALVGLFSVGRGIVPGTELPVFASAEVSGPAAIQGLPPFPGAARAEFREEVFGDERVTEVEYVVDCELAEVRAHYRDALARGGWTVTGSSWVHGEWIYTVRSGERHGVVEIEHHGGLTEIEVEISEPVSPAGEEVDR
jgi:hypothetical protein